MHFFIRWFSFLLNIEDAQDDSVAFFWGNKNPCLFLYTKADGAGHKAKKKIDFFRE